MQDYPTLTTRDVSEKLKIHITTVLRLVKKGQLTAYKYGKGYRFYSRDIETFVNSRKADDNQELEGIF